MTANDASPHGSTTDHYQCVELVLLKSLAGTSLAISRVRDCCPEVLEFAGNDAQYSWGRSRGDRPLGLPGDGMLLWCPPRVVVPGGFTISTRELVEMNEFSAHTFYLIGRLIEKLVRTYSLVPHFNPAVPEEMDIYTNLPDQIVDKGAKEELAVYLRAIEHYCDLIELTLSLKQIGLYSTICG